MNLYTGPRKCETWLTNRKTFKVSGEWHAECFITLNSWHFVFAIWSLDWKLKSLGVNILIELESERLQSSTLKASERCLWPCFSGASGTQSCEDDPSAPLLIVLCSPSALQVAAGQMSSYVFFLLYPFTFLRDLIKKEVLPLSLNSE